MEHEIVVHVWSDVACPWCWIGKHRLEEGIRASGQKVAVEYHAYQLTPDAPTSPSGSAAEHLAHSKGVPLEDVLQSFDQVTEIAASHGLDMNFDVVQEVNTFEAHQLVHAAKAAGATPEEAAIKGGEMMERLYIAHFSEGKNVADSDTLLEIAAEMGLDVDAVENELEGGDHAGSVRADIADAKRLGISGVPFYVVGGKYGLSGAQKPEIFTQVIEMALEEMRTEEAYKP